MTEHSELKQTENVYYMVCNLCREKFDPSDLGEVFKHEHDDELKTDGKYLGVRI